MEVSFVALGRTPRFVKLQDERRILDIELTPGARSGPHRCAPAQPLVLFTEQKNAEGQAIKVTLASVNYPAAWQRVVVFLSESGGASPLHVLAVDDGFDSFPAGQMKLFNFYSGALAAGSGTAAPVQIASGQSALVPLAANARGKAWIRMAVQNGPRWKTLPPFVTEVSPRMRALALAYEQNGEPARTVIFDSVPDPAAEEARSSAKPAALASR